jgi:tellurium resistance protein TerZ
MISDATSVVAGATIVIQVVEGKNLVAKDRSLLRRKATTSDPYVIVRYNQKTIGQTKTIHKNCISPHWQYQTFRIHFNADEAQQLLQSYKTTQRPSMIDFCIMDEDLVSSPDPMGVVQVPLPLGPGLRTESWYPVTTGIPNTPYYCRNATGELLVTVTTELKQMYTLHRGNVLNSNQLPQGQRRLTVGLAWDIPKGFGNGIDLDSCCVAIDRYGNVLMNETVYYGNLCNPNRSIVHSGDETTGIKAGDDECIDIDLNRVPHNVLALYILLFVASPPEQTFKNVTSAQVRILATDTKAGICRFVPSEIAGSSTALFLVRIARDGTNSSNNDWTITPIEESDNYARDFGSLIPELKGYTRDLIPSIVIDPKERIAIMRKGGTIRVADYVPNHVVPEWLTFGLAWDVTNGVAIDLDASAILLDKQLKLVDAVWFCQLTSKDGSIRHSGDVLQGDASGDDEKISFSLSQVPANVAYIGLVINSFSGQELDDVAQASCHLFDPKTNVDIAKYTLSNCAALDRHTALVMGCLYRSQLVDGDGGSSHGGWYLRIIAEAAQGRTVHDNVDELQRFLQSNPPQKASVPPEPEIVLNAMPDPILVEEEEIVIPIPEEEIHVLMK